MCSPPDGDDDLVGILRHDEIRGRLDTQPNVRAASKRLATVPGKVALVVRLLAEEHRCLLEASSQLFVTLEEDDVVTALDGGLRRHHAGRTTPDDDHFLFHARLGNLAVVELAAELRIDRATHATAHGRTRRALDAAQARPDGVLLAAIRLVHQVHVGEDVAGESDDVGLALGKDMLGRLDIGNVADAGHGDVKLFADDGGARDVEAQLLRIAWHHVLDVDRVEDPAARQVRVINVLLRRLEKGDDVLERGAAFDVFVLADAEVDGHVVAHGLTHGLHEPEREAHAVLEGSAVLIGTLVGKRREERAHQVAMRTVDEHHVETRIAQTHGRLAEEIDDLVHLLLGDLLEKVGVHVGVSHGTHALRPASALGCAMRPACRISHEIAAPYRCTSSTRRCNPGMSSSL